MDLEELPKAEKFFKQIVDKKITNYIQSSQKVADEYEKQKKQALQNSQHCSASIEELKRQIKILKTIQTTKLSLPGTTSEDVQNLIEKYQRVVDNFSHQVQPNIKNIQKQQQLESEEDFKSQIINSEYSLNLEENYLVFPCYELNQQQLEEKNRRKKKIIISYGLKSVEFITITLIVVAFVKIMFFV